MATPKIIPTKLKNRIKKAAQQEAASLWDIADLSNEVMEHVRLEQTKERLKGVYDFQVWTAIGVLCAKRARRVQKLAAIAQAFPPEKRGGYVEKWDFGYFERAFDVGPPIIDLVTGEVGRDERMQAIEFLDDYAKGDLSEGIPHEPTIGDFLPMYRQHILGLETRGGGLDESSESQLFNNISAVPDAPSPTPLENLRDALNQAYAYIVARDQPDKSLNVHVLSLIDELDENLKKIETLLRLPTEARAPVEDILIEN